MIPYSLIMFAVAILFSVFSLLIYRGKTELIHSYHQGKVTDKAAYGKAFGKALISFAVAPAVSGVIGLIGDSDAVVTVAVATLLVGMAIGSVCIYIVQKKYNGSIIG